MIMIRTPSKRKENIHSFSLILFHSLSHLLFRYLFKYVMYSSNERLLQDDTLVPLVREQEMKKRSERDREDSELKEERERSKRERKKEERAAAGQMLYY